MFSSQFKLLLTDEDVETLIIRGTSGASPAGDSKQASDKGDSKAGKGDAKADKGDSKADKGDSKEESSKISKEQSELIERVRKQSELIERVRKLVIAKDEKALTETIKQLSVDQTIDFICSLAKSQEIPLLNVLLNSGNICIDVTNGLETAAMRIASEETVDRNALNLLLSMGAGAYEAAIGAKLADHVDLVETLVNRYAEQELVEELKLKRYERLKKRLEIIHAVYIGNIEQMSKLIQDIKADSRQDQDILTDTPFISIYKCKYKATDQQMEKLIDKLIELGCSTEGMIFEAGYLGDITYVQKLLSRGGSRRSALKGAAYGGESFIHALGVNNDNDRSDCIAGAAAGGHVHVLEEYLQQPLSLEPEDSKYFINIAVKFARKHYNLVNRLTSRYGADINEIKNDPKSKKYETVTDWVMRVASLEDPMKRKLYSEGWLWKKETPLYTIANQAAILRQLNQSITLKQSIAWQCPDVQACVVFGLIAKYDIPNRLWHLIALYASPFLFDNPEVKKFSDAFSLGIRKTVLNSRLTDYRKETTPFWGERKQDGLDELKAKLKQANTHEEFDKLVATPSSPGITEILKGYARK